MSKYKCILFDCMETLVDVIEKPDVRLYAYWAYAGCGCEALWESFDAFLDQYNMARGELGKLRAEFEEYDMSERFEFMAQQLTNDSAAIKNITEAVSYNYWRNYKSNCIVYDNVKSLLDELYSEFKLGVVSNFMVKDGIEELLKIFDIDKYFDFVVTSINVGWKKPHSKIYDTALNLAQVSKKEILFVGDDYDCDFIGPTKFGFDTVLLDKECIHSNVERRITSLDNLTEFL